MDKPTQDADNEVGLASVAMSEEKSGKTGKREAEEPLVEATSSKKQKGAYIEKLNQTPPEDESASIEQDTYPKSEEEENVSSKVIGKDGNNEEEVDNSDKNSDTTILRPTPEGPVGNQNKRGATTIYIRNLPSKIEDELAGFFKEAGEVTEVKLATFGHVKFATEEAAKMALKMNLKKFMGCEVKIEMAQQNVSSTPGDMKDNSSNPKGEDEGTDVVMEDALSSGRLELNKKEPKTTVGNENEGGLTTIFVGNLPFDANEDDIGSFFKEVGEAIEVRLAWYANGYKKGFCLVEFATEEAAKKALELNQKEFMGRKLKLEMAKPKVYCTPNNRKNYSSNRKGGSRGDLRAHRSGRGGDRSRRRT